MNVRDVALQVTMACKTVEAPLALRFCEVVAVLIRRTTEPPEGSQFPLHDGPCELHLVKFIIGREMDGVSVRIVSLLVAEEAILVITRTSKQRSVLSRHRQGVTSGGAGAVKTPPFVLISVLVVSENRARVKLPSYVNLLLGYSNVAHYIVPL